MASRARATFEISAWGVSAQGGGTGTTAVNMVNAFGDLPRLQVHQCVGHVLVVMCGSCVGVHEAGHTRRATLIVLAGPLTILLAAYTWDRLLFCYLSFRGA